MKVGLVARRGLAFIDGLRSMPEVVIDSFCEKDESMLAKYGEKYCIPNRFTDFDSMLERDLDAVIIGSPMHFHVSQSVKALEAGKHVLCEVPAAVSLEECWELLETVNKCRKKYMMAENYCYWKTNALIREMVKKGFFGEVYFAEGEYVSDMKPFLHDEEGNPTWRHYWQVGRNGCTYGTHQLGPILQWLDEKAKTVSCFGTGVHTQKDHVMEDSVLVLCKTESDKLTKIRLDLVSNRPHRFYYSLQGTKGCYESPSGFGDDHKIWLMDHTDDIKWPKWRSLRDFESYLPDYWKNAPKEAFMQGRAGGDYWIVEGDYFVVKDFINSILKEKQPPIDIGTSLNWTAADLCSQISIANGGKPVEVPEFTIEKVHGS